MIQTSTCDFPLVHTFATADGAQVLLHCDWLKWQCDQTGAGQTLTGIDTRQPRAWEPGGWHYCNLHYSIPTRPRQVLDCWQRQHNFYHEKGKLLLNLENMKETSFLFLIQLLQKLNDTNNKTNLQKWIYLLSIWLKLKLTHLSNCLKTKPNVFRLPFSNLTDNIKHINNSFFSDFCFIESCK